MGPNLALALALLLALPLVPGARALAQEAAQDELPRTRLSLNIYQIDAELAQTPQQQTVGLMFRRSMPMHQGMLFVFDQPQRQCFWMKNTLIALTAAFIADDGTVVNLEDMKPRTTDPHCSARPVRYVLEVNQGWFAKKGLTAGARFKGGPFGD